MENNKDIGYIIYGCIGGKTPFTELAIKNNSSEFPIFDLLIHEYAEYLDWDIITKKFNKDSLYWKDKTVEEFNSYIKEVSDYMNWNIFSRYCKFTIETIKEFENKINFRALSCNISSLSEEIIDSYKDKLYWDKISEECLYNKNETFLRKYSDYIKWNKIREPLLYVRLSFIEEYGDKIGWDRIILTQNGLLNEYFVDKNYDKFINKNNIIENVSFFSNDFIEKHYDDFDKKTLFKEQLLDRDFIERHINDYSYNTVKEWNILDKDGIEYYYGKRPTESSVIDLIDNCDDWL